jgi:predicted RNA binding protein YcfA (HicA-like mRNA interferase family)
MKLPRDLSGNRLADHLIRYWGYNKVNQVGSHIILQTTEPAPHRLAIPAHDFLRIGTLNSILRSVATAKRVQREDVLDNLR